MLDGQYSILVGVLLLFGDHIFRWNKMYKLSYIAWEGRTQMLIFTNVHRCQNWRTSSFYPGHELAVVSRQLAGIWTNVPGNWVILLHDAQQMLIQRDILFTNWERSGTCWAWEAGCSAGVFMVVAAWVVSVVWDESRGFNEMSSDCSHASCPPPPPPAGSGGACAANGDTPKKKFVKMLQSMIWKWLPLSSWFYAMEYGSM